MIRQRQSRLNFNAFRKFLKDRTGGVAAIVAIVSPVVVGAMGLGAEVGYWYLSERKLQNAADVAAHATALRMGQGDDEAALSNWANYVVGEADVNMTQTTVGLATPPMNGAYIEDNNAVEITLNQTVPRLFSAIYDTTPLEISARAVASVDRGGRGCVLALNETEDGAISVTGSNTVNLVQCDFVSNSRGISFDMQGLGASGIANCVRGAGQVLITTGLVLTCGAPVENAAPVADPFAGRPEPALTGTCQNSNVGSPNGNVTLTPSEAHASGMSAMRFCNGLDLKGTVNLDPGIYLIEGGDFRINSNAVIAGSGVVFYLANGVEANINGTAQLDLTSPTSGVYNGMLIFGSRNATTMSHLINGNAATTLNGAIYTPESHIDFQGNNNTGFTSCTQIVTDTITFTGNSTMSMHCLFPPSDTTDIVGQVRIVE